MSELAAGAGTSAEASVTVVAEVFREERGRLLAALVRRFGDLDLAEEVTSEAFLRRRLDSVSGLADGAR